MARPISTSLLIQSILSIVLAMTLVVTMVSVALWRLGTNQANERLGRATTAMDRSLTSAAQDLRQAALRVTGDREMSSKAGFLQENARKPDMASMIIQERRGLAVRSGRAMSAAGATVATLYAADGRLICASLDQDDHLHLFVPDDRTDTFLRVDLSAGAEPQPGDWKPEPLPPGLVAVFTGAQPDTTISRLVADQGGWRVEAIAPMLVEGLNTTTFQMEQAQRGVLVLGRGLDQRFLDQESNRLGVQLNLYVASRLSAGTAADFAPARMPGSSATAPADGLDLAAITFGTAAFGLNASFVALAPLRAGGADAGALALLISQSDMRQGLYWVAILTVVAGAIAGVLALLLNLVMSRRIVEPITDTVAVLRAMAAGDTSRRLPETGSHELTLLAQAVNTTVDGMQKVQDGLSAEIAERRRAEHALRLMEAAVNQINEAVIVTSPGATPETATILLVNPAFCVVTGWNAAAVAGRPLDLLAGPATDRAAFTRLIATAAGGGDAAAEFLCRRQNGSEYPSEWHACPIRDADGKVGSLVAIQRDITERRRAQQELEAANRQAGMAEIATGVLHNVGNVLNSVNVSVGLLGERLARTRPDNLGKTAALLDEGAQIPDFLRSDRRGMQLPAYLTRLAQMFTEDRKAMEVELGSLAMAVDHLKAVVCVQQSYARTSNVLSVVRPVDICEDALRMNQVANEREGIVIRRDYADLPALPVDRHRILQILLNLLTNARQAMRAMGPGPRTISITLLQPDPTRLRFIVADQGVGIPAEQLVAIFSHGFTTKAQGHGFGLHRSANAAAEMGGTLTAASEGSGKGARFTLEIPCDTLRSEAEASSAVMRPAATDTPNPGAI